MLAASTIVSGSLFHSLTDLAKKLHLYILVLKPAFTNLSGWQILVWRSILYLVSSFDLAAILYKFVNLVCFLLRFNDGYFSSSSKLVTVPGVR